MVRVLGAVATTLVILLILCYNVNSIAISPCNDNGVTRRRELDRCYSSCSYLYSNTTGVDWFLISRAGQSVLLATTFPWRRRSYHPAISSESRGPTYIGITFNATREMAGTLVCSVVFGNGTTLSDNCTQDVVYPFEVEDFNVTMNLQNWSLTAVFSTQKVFSALGSYYVDIKEYTVGVNGSSTIFSRLPPVVSKTSLKPYTDKLLYYRGTLTVTWSLPDRGGNYYYLGDIVPNGPTDLRIHPKIRGYFVISEPSPPTTNCPLTYVPEGGPITCMCSAKSLGTPPGRLQWLVGDDVISSGGYGVTQLQFPTNRVNRSHDGVEVTCQLDWVVKQHVTVASSVAYGPRDVSIQVISANCGVTATCTVDEVKPFTPDMIQWGGLCRGQQGAVCVFTSRGAVDDGEEVTCTVINNANNGHSVTSSVVVTLTDCVSTSSIPVKDTMATSVGASVGAALGVSVLMVCLVLVIMWIHRRHSAESVDSRKECQENHYSCLYEVSGRETNQSNTAHNTVNPGCEPNLYENV
ncbi:uncharacterized protein LOC112568252 [Pomacea canaliculata]|uniref:uncharacterized protein LOC112568252 n=1 Tax=Pomacea canaliculata TaxID=400727 RepID=UPI000D73A3D4|nr:uncharacterized protein LOC112568252 [Pomacea canaliculata]